MSRFPRTRLATVAIGLSALALTATACSDGGSSGGKKPPAEMSPDGVIITSSTTPYGPITTKNFNPYNAQGPAQLVGGGSLVNEPLFITNPLKDTEITPWLAKSWEFAPDGLSMTLTLQTGVNWTDGKPFTADDVAFTFNMIKDNPAINANGLALKGASVLAPDKVKVDFPVPGYWMQPHLGNTLIVPKHLWEGKDPATFDFAEPVGTGPFMLDPATFSQQGYLMKKNPKYWQPGLPKIGGIRYTSYNSNTNANLALKQGQVAWTGNFVNNIESEYMSADKANNKYWNPPIRPTFLCMNLTKPQYQKAEVRKAISLALDRKMLTKIAEQDQQPPNMNPGGLVLPQHDQYVADKYKGKELTQDVAKAKELLAQAGYKPGSDGILVGPDGKKFEMTLSAPTSFTDIITMYQLMTDQLKAVGISVKTDGGTLPQWYGNLMTGNFDASVCGPNTATYTPFDIYQNLLAGYMYQPIGKPSPANQIRWQDAKTDQLLQQYMSTNDKAVQKQASDGLQDIMAEQVPAIPIFNFVSWSQYNTRDVTGWPSAENPYGPASPGGLPGTLLVATRLEPVKK